MKCKNCGKKVYSKEMCVCGEKAPDIHGKGVAANSIICAIILVLTVFSLILSISLRYIVNKNLLVKTVENVNLCEIEVENDSGKKVKLDQYIYDEFIDDERITVENVDNVLNDPFIKDFIIEKIEGYQKFFMDEGEMVYIRSEDIVNLIDENSDLLYNEAGLNFLEPDKIELKEELEGLDIFSDICRDYFTGWFTSGYIQTYFSFAYVVFLGVLLIVILVQWLAVYAINGRRMMKALKKYSIAVIVPSALIFLLTLPTIFFSEKSIVQSITKEIRNPIIISSGIIMAAGVLLLVISILFGSKRQENAEVISDEAQTAIENPAQDQPVIENVKTEEAAETVYSAPKAENSYDNKPDNSVFAPKTDENKNTDDKPDTDKEAKESEPKPTETNVDSAVKEPKKVFCTKCGHENRSNSSFCSMCGEKLRIK